MEDERALENRVKRFEMLLDSTPNIAIQGYAPDTTVHFWNGASEKLYGYSKSEALGRSILDLIIPPHMREQVGSAIAESARSGVPIPAAELELVHKCGRPVDVYSSHAVIRFDDGEVELFCLDLDIGERKRTQEALDRREREYRLLVENQSDLVVRIDGEGRFEFVSESYCELFGKTREELIGHSFVPLVHEEDRAHTLEAMKKLYEPPYRTHMEQRAMTRHGWRWLEWEDRAVLDEGGAVAGIIGSGRDITRRKEAELERARSEERMRMILDLLPVPIAISEGADERVLLYNRKFHEVFGYSSEEVSDVEAWFERAYPDAVYRDEVRQEWHRRMETATHGEPDFDPMDVQVTCSDGTVRSVSVRGYSIGDIHMVVFVDFTDLYEIRRKLEDSVAEKEALMRELNHRVKNNLAMVSSLIGLKDSALGDAADLSDIRTRISAISFIHEKLYETEDITHIDFRAYTRALLPSIFSFHAGPRVHIEDAVDGISLPTRTAVNLGLLVNELATNAMKHGFTPDEEPRFSVTLSENCNDDCYLLTVTNSGRPFPPDIDLETPQSMGLRLVRALVDQLGGSIELSRTPHPSFAVRVPRGS